ncbi:MAG: metallophosphoesterase, partial [Candidatus Saccharimonadales bacterium]
MKKRIPFAVALWLITDLYFFGAIETLTTSIFILCGYWLFDILTGTAILYITLARGASRKNPALLSWLMALMLLSLVPKIVAVPVLLLEDISRLFRGFPERSKWVSELTLIVAAVPFLGLLFGLTRGRHHYRIRKETLFFNDLPDTFDGFTITQISDIHAGGFSSQKGVEKGIALVNRQNSDLLLFTGDLVNNKASEMDRWIPAFSQLKAKYGKFSVLGNHDYGDYTKWESKAHKYANLGRLKKVHHEIGFRLLLNEAVTIERGGKAISLIGVENWGKGRFHKYGDLAKAAANVPDDAFKILMSHD